MLLEFERDIAMKFDASLFVSAEEAVLLRASGSRSSQFNQLF